MSRRPLLPALLCLALLSSPLFCGSVPPFEESVDLTLLTLNRLSLERTATGAPGLLPKKAKGLPASVRMYLRATHQLDLYSPAVDRAAARIRRAVAPGREDQDALRDSPAVARAVTAWLDAHLARDPGADGDAQPCLDWRLSYPRVSTLLRQGHADGNGRALAAVALLRVLKVPARIAWAKGGLTVQYWVAAKPTHRKPERHRRGLRARAPREPLGWWACLDPALGDADVDAWSLDPSSLACLRWKPDQQLDVSLLGWERAAFPDDLSAAARAAYAASLAAGHLSGTALAGPLSATAAAALDAAGSGKAGLWVLTAQHWRLRTQGALQGMSSVQLLTPYRPDLASWGRERRGAVLGSELEAEGVWSDRPARLRLRTASADEWSSPPPALGLLHWYTVGVRRQQTVLEASRHGALLQGVVFRGDNLSPRPGWSVRVTAQGLTQSAATVVAGDGSFSLALDAALVQADCLEVVAQAPDQEQVEQRLLLGY